MNSTGETTVNYSNYILYIKPTITPTLTTTKRNGQLSGKVLLNLIATFFNGTIGNTTGGSGRVYINDVVIYQRSAGGDYATGETLNVPLTKLSAGDVVKVSNASSYPALHIFATKK